MRTTSADPIQAAWPIFKLIILSTVVKGSPAKEALDIHIARIRQGLDSLKVALRARIA